MTGLSLTAGQIVQIDDGSCASFTVTLTSGGPVEVAGTELYLQHASSWHRDTYFGFGEGVPVTVKATSTAHVEYTVTAAQIATSAAVLTDRGNWAGPGTAYAAGDAVSNSGVRYECNTAHTSSSAFSTDAAKWTQLGIDSANAVALSTSAADFQSTSTSAADPGSTGRGADAGHVHKIGAHDHTTSAKGGQIPVGAIQATGTADSTHYLRGDGAWATAGGGGGSAMFGYNPAANAYHIRPIGSGVTAVSLSSGFMRAVLLTLPEARTIIAAACEVVVLGSGETVRFGVFDDVNGVPTNRLYEFPSTADASTTGVKEVSGSYAASAGRIWVIGCHQGGSTATFRAMSAPIDMGSEMSTANFGTVVAGYYNTAGGVTGALPSTFGSVSEAPGNTLFRLGIKLG